MKNNPLTTILLVALAVSAVWSAILCFQFIRNTRELRMMQGDALRIGNQEGRAQAMLNDVIAYSTNHPAIDPVLESLGIKKAGPVAAPAVPAAATPAVRTPNR